MSAKKYTKKNIMALKLFITFFILYTFFIHWTGWDENSRFALTKALSQEKRVEIDSFYIITGDRAYFNNHYYTDKAPGISFISVPIYSFLKYFYDNFFSDEFKAKHSTKLDIYISEHPKAVVYFYPYLGFLDRMAMIFLTIFTSSLFGALSVVLFYDTSKFFTKDEKVRIITSFIFGIATLVFPYSIRFTGNIIGMFLGLLSFRFYLNKEKNSYFLTGLISGLASFFDYPLLLFLFIYILIGFFFNTKFLKYFFIGATLGVLPLLMYNYLIFGNPFSFSNAHLDPQISEETGGIGVSLNPEFLLSLIPRVLFYPERGLFFYYPILIVSLVGIFYMKSQFEIERRIIILVFVLFVLFNCSYWTWWGGSTFGPKYLLPTIPFLAIPLIFVIERFKSISRVYKSFFVVLLAVSIFHNFLGLQPLMDLFPNFIGLLPLEKGVTFDMEKYIQEIKSLTLFNNPLYEYYLPLFVRDGPRSRIFEAIFHDLSEIDIRTSFPIWTREIKLFTLSPFGILVVNIPFLILPVILTFVLLIWRKELSFHIQGKLSLITLISIVIVLLFLSRFEFKEIVFSKGFYPEEITEEGERLRWLEEKASVILFSPREEKTNLFFKVGTFLKPRMLEIEVNGKVLNQLVSSYDERFVFPEVLLKKGENVINLRSLGDCERPMLVEKNSRDYRCLSITIKEISTSSITKFVLVLGSNWYTPEENITWAYENSTIFIFSPLKIGVKLNLSVVSYHKPRTVDIFLNDVFFDAFRVDTFGTNLITKTFYLKEGANMIKIVPEEKCDVPALIEGRNDTRCLSIGLLRVEVIQPTKGDYVLFGPNWYEEEYDGRWMNNNASIFIFSERDREASLFLELVSYYKSRKMDLYLNGNLIVSQVISSNRTRIDKQIKLLKGENLLEIKSKDACDIPYVIEKTTDKRCLSFKLSSFKIS
jgi:hypothetical protein